MIVSGCHLGVETWQRRWDDNRRIHVCFVTAADGAQNYFEDWGAGRPVILSDGHP